jgi:hypothetical protein
MGVVVGSLIVGYLGWQYSYNGFVFFPAVETVILCFLWLVLGMMIMFGFHWMYPFYAGFAEQSIKELKG